MSKLNFAAWIGRMSYDPGLIENIQLTPYVQRAVNVNDLCNRIFPPAQLANVHDAFEFFADRAILAVRNTDLAEFNAPLLQRLPSRADMAFKMVQGKTNVFSISSWNPQSQSKSPHIS